MFRLKIASVDMTIVSPTVPVRWCLDKDFLGGLDLQEREELFVLLAVRRKDGGSSDNEQRDIVPANLLERYLVFRQPGEYAVMGMLLKSRSYQDDRGFYSAKAVLWNKYGSEDSHWKLSGIHWRGDGEPVWGSSQPNSVGDPSFLIVDVPANCFAPEPAAWEKKWVNLLLKNPLVDQCAFRRRRLFAYTLQPLYLATKLTLGMACRWLAAIVSLLFGIWDLNFAPLIHPFRYGFMEIWEWVDTSDNFYILGYIWIGNAIRKAVDGPISDEERTERWSRVEEASKRQRLQVYRNLGCDLESKEAADLVPFTGKVYLFYNGLKKRVCRPFSR